MVGKEDIRRTANLPARADAPRSRGAWAVLTCLAVVACGGGGGGGGSGPGANGAPQVPPAPPASSAPGIDVDRATTTFTLDRAVTTEVRWYVTLPLRNVPTSGLFVSGDYTRVGLLSIGLDTSDPKALVLTMGHRKPTTLFNGTYADRVTIRACLDQACTRPLDGSPLTFPVTYRITGADPVTGATGPVPDTDAPLPFRSRTALPHDVRDAEYSRSLDRIVMVASYPSNALHVHDPASGTASSVPLSRPPTAVALSADGLTAAVGHAGLISVVDLARVGQQPAPTVRQVTVASTVFDLAIDGRGRVHYSPDVDEGDTIRTVELATGLEERSAFAPVAYGQSSLALLPSGDLLFQLSRNVSSSLQKWDVTGRVARYVIGGEIQSSFRFACGRLWTNDPGTRVYSQCGQAFATAGPPNVSMAPFGRLALSGPAVTQDAWTVTSLDDSAARREIALVESNASWCSLPEFGRPCYSRLGVFDAATLARRASYALAPVAVAGQPYVQRGLHVFQPSNGARRFLISRLESITDPAAEYWLTVLD